MRPSGVDEILDRISSQYLTIDMSTIAVYRRVFNTDDGREVLTDLLTILGFFSTSNASIEEALLENVGKLILAKCGAWHAEQLRTITKQIMEQPAAAPGYTKTKES